MREPVPSTARPSWRLPLTALTRRLFGRWWRQQSPARQDRFATLAPLLSVLLFLAAITSAFWYLRNEEIERETESVRRDTELTQQQITLRLIQSQEALARMSRELPAASDAQAFATVASSFVRDRPEVARVLWLDGQGRLQAAHAGLMFQGQMLETDAPPSAPLDAPAEPMAWASLREARAPVFSRALRDSRGSATFQLLVPVLDRNRIAGALVAEYAVDILVQHLVPSDVARRHLISVVDGDQRVLASTATATPTPASRRAPIVSEAPLAPITTGLALRGQGWRTGIGLVDNTLFWMVVALAGLTVWMLLGSWRHMRRRGQIQAALVQETNFRRAMENSMSTGMRAMDLAGRVTHVNAAFCQMTGFSQEELVGLLPPYPYWPPDRLEENARLLQQELQGRSPSRGIEVKVMRKGGEVFDARMYISPLIDAKGQQTGWMTSMTNITEAKRIRDQLSASHERFTTVLEGLDASVSVLSVQQGELLFANRSYRLWFSSDAKGHQQLAGGGATSEASFKPEVEDDAVDGLGGLPTHSLTEAGADPREVYVEALQKWFDVRARYLQWTDGRLAQMLIATDITARIRAEEQAAAQAEKAQVTSRLMTMGEMASSVAHELNQPLTAINNYCNGMVSRIKANAIGQDDLVTALQKTARQAERAGQIIHRIRNFVKRSEPQRQPAQAKAIVEEAVELASIALRRRNVTIHTYVAQRLPDLMVDPILIEQVVLNLLKNAAEAIDQAQMPPQRREIELRVVPRHNAEEGGVIEFSVSDTGPGIPDEVLERLYEAFYSTKAEGMGIGLSLCRSIVESHRGRMRAQNLYNGSQVTGCRFAFTIPVELPVKGDISTDPTVGTAAADAASPNSA